MMSLIPLAHETWFTHETFPTDWGFAGQKLTLLFLALAVVVTLLVRAIARKYPGIDIPVLGRMAPWMPFALRIHLAASLVGLAAAGAFLSPAMDLPTTFFGVLLGVGMVLCAIGMAAGFYTRAAAWLLIVLGPLGMIEFGVWQVLARVDLLGLAVFLLFTGPGLWSADVESGREQPSTNDQLGKGVWALRLAVGAALIIVAFQEKLATPAMGLDFLHHHSNFNIAQSVFGLNWTDLQFLRVAGALEVLFGLLLISGALPQACVVIAGIPFNATLWFFGTVELLGHLPVYGAMLVLLVMGSDPDLRPRVSRMWPFGREAPEVRPRPAAAGPPSLQPQ